MATTAQRLGGISVDQAAGDACHDRADMRPIKGSLESEELKENDAY
eukprot:CAMPEP_0181250676 /NCGR_PEP_ID=MMETSP1096-20121128/46448_1 /TAXON_ID=156174 ORGANISM="Chrysochromulina ericina, Strain CCMP281" /NCGR_SAMPLE_ID=MMETSP1096 /ASSEMBLY_ACC=CAM_ASM_000453 /LENGTH=45 /DNA_ID= /DNA_START= /DNA_END= /DNA_ORIENTATION=